MLIAALIAVLLGEIGGRLAALDWRRPLAIVLLAAMLAVAAFAGLGLANELTPWARLLLVAVALIAAGLTQIVARPPDPLPAWLAFWRSGAPLSVLALSAYGGTLWPALGGAIGVGAAVVLGPVVAPHARIARRIAGAPLLLAGMVAALGGLRII